MKNVQCGLRLNALWNDISRLPVKRRKQIVLLCRAQDVIFDDPFNLLAIQTELTHTSLYTRSSSTEYSVYLHVVRAYKDFITSPYMSSVVLDFCRSAPLTRLEVKEEQIKSWGKEISICERADRNRHLDYSCWFDEAQDARPLMSGIPARPHMARRINLALRQWRDQVTKTTLFPRMSTKGVSADTIKEWEHIYGRSWSEPGDSGTCEFSQERLERTYHDDGVEVPGVCEIRQKWYRSGVTPRTYFAQGGTSYKYSKYIQGIASALTEQLETTHPISRLNPARIILAHPDQYLRIYDLSGFTSNHWECKYFLERLADWCSGYFVTIMDARSGAVQTDLGELIREYNTHMNFNAAYDPRRIIDDIDGMLNHNQAGFLGVYGNINFSTFVHGASVLMLVDNTVEANVAGDDAHYAQTYGEEDISDRVILANGVFEVTKVFRSDQPGAVCLKRGLLMVEGRILPKLMFVFPSFSLIGMFFDYHPPQFTVERISKREIVDMICNDVYRFLRFVSIGESHLDLDIILDLLTTLYLLLRLPLFGGLPPWSDRLIPVLPETPVGLIGIDPIDVLLRNHFDSGCMLPKIDPDNSYDAPRFISGEIGSSWSSRSSPLLRYLKVLGYVVDEQEQEMVWGVEAYDRLRDAFLGRSRNVYLYRVVREIPSHLQSAELGY